MESRNLGEMTHASPLATQGKTQAQPLTVNWLERSQRRSMDLYKPIKALSDMVWHDFDKAIVIF